MPRSTFPEHSNVSALAKVVPIRGFFFFFPLEIYWLILWEQIKGAAYYKSIKDKKRNSANKNPGKISHLPSSPFQFSFMGLLKGKSGAGRSSLSPHECHTCGIPARPSGMSRFMEPPPFPGDQPHLLPKQEKNPFSKANFALPAGRGW